MGARLHSIRKRVLDDPRNSLVRDYVRIVSELEAEYFVFENVLGLLSAGTQMYLNEMIQLFESIGYTSVLQVLNAEEYGVLQRRRRVIIIGRRGKKKFPFPEIETIENN